MALDVTSFSDYRSFLREWFWHSKAQNRKVSFRYLSRMVGLKSPNHFHLVINHRRHLSPKSFDNALKLIRLSAEERQYLRLLFARETEKSDEKKSRADRMISAIAASRQGEGAMKHEILTNILAWYIKMGARVFDGMKRADLFSFLLESSTFPVNEAQVQKALKVLSDLGYLTWDDDTCKVSPENLKTEWDTNRAEIRAFHVSNLQNAIQAAQWPIDRRFFSNVSVTCDQKTVDAIKQEIRELCLRILKMADENQFDENDSKVISLELALVPYFEFKQTITI